MKKKNNEEVLDDEQESIEEEVSENTSKKKYKKIKTKKPFSLTSFLFSIVAKLLFGIIGVCAIIFAVFYFKFNVNLINAIYQTVIVNQAVNESDFVTNAYTEDDLHSINGKIADFNSSDKILTFTDSEIASLVAKNLKDNPQLTSYLGSPGSMISNKDIEILQIDLYNTIKKKEETHLSSVNVVFKLNFSTIKNQKMYSFPYNLAKTAFPDKFLISLDFDLEKNTAEDSTSYYAVYPKEIRINNLSAAQSKEFLTDLHALFSTGSYDSFISSLSSIFSDNIVNETVTNSLYSKVKAKGAKCYSFFTDETSDYLVIYCNGLDETATITYNNLKEADNSSNPSEYMVLDNRIVLEKISSNGYEFLGWYDSLGDDANLVQYINAWNMENVSVYAKWKIIEYQIEYVLRGGVLSHQNPTTYNIESDFVLYNPYKTEMTPFEGWTGTNLTEQTLTVRIKNCYGDLKFYAHFDDDERSLMLYHGDTKIGEMIIIINETIDKDEVNNVISEYINDQMSGFVVNKWYTNKALTSQYDFSAKVFDDVYLYGEFEYMVNTLKFYPYLSKFDNAVKSKKLTINSKSEFIAYFEYMSFYQIGTSVNLKFTYLSSRSEFENELNDIQNNYHNKLLPYYTISYSINGLFGNFDVDLSVSSMWNSGGTLLTMDENKEYINSQKYYALSLSSPNTRDDEFDDFKINNIEKTITVEHSWQLVYCLEQGYRPICKPNSSAEKMYEKAKQILREICSDEMSNYKKIRAIYEWLILNVSYDQKAYQMAINSDFNSKNLSRYDSWYVEGVLNNGVAVCEGYAKTLILMARIEGIPALYITGNSHAWNRVYIDGHWFGIDATQGDTQQSFNGGTTYEVFNNYNYLFTDAYKTSLGYTSDDYSQFSATTTYNYYENVSFTYNLKTYDLHCTSKLEFSNLIKFIKTYMNELNITSYTFEVEIENISIQDVVNVYCSVYFVSSANVSEQETVSGLTSCNFTV